MTMRMKRDSRVWWLDVEQWMELEWLEEQHDERHFEGVEWTEMRKTIWIWMKIVALE
jgi:hypothetical protein